MAIYQSAAYTAQFTINDQDGNPVNITGWLFHSMFRAELDDDPPLLDLSSANGGWVMLDPVNGRVQMQITKVQAATLPLGRVIFDVMRTDPALSPVYLFSGRVKVKEAVTR
jgi:hypothetical protein